MLQKDDNFRFQLHVKSLEIITLILRTHKKKNRTEKKNYFSQTQQRIELTGQSTILKYRNTGKYREPQLKQRISPISVYGDHKSLEP